MEEAEPARKRKRRRRSKAARPQSQAPTAVSGAAAAHETSITDKKGQKRSKKARHRRGLQGRPLTSGDKPLTVERPADGQRPRGVSAAPQPSRKDDMRAPHVAPSEPPAPLYAALDLGTNNCRLLVAQPTRPGQFRVVDAFSRIVRLGEGLGASGRLSDDAMERSVEALKICAGKLNTRSIRRRRLIATEAARAAENGAIFMKRVAEETGLDLEIIDRETEARLAVSGCSSLVDRETKSVVLFDIGGGSSEIAVIRIGDNRSSRLANHITHWTSLPVGVVTLSERHGGEHVTPQSFETMVREVEGMLDRFDGPSVEALESASGSGFHLIGTSGTVTTLAGVHLDLPRYDRRRVDGLWLSDDEVSAMQARLLSWDFAARAANPCIGPDRADLVLAGCAILEAIRRRWPSTRMRVADRGLREGLLTDMMADDGAWRRGRPRRHQRGPAQAGDERQRSHEGNKA
nr:Ppx/GppA phosphatase family protein [Sinorhizobium fredii]